MRLPDPLPAGQHFAAEALVYYPIYSVWRPGQFVRMDFTGHFTPESPASVGRSTNPIPGGGGTIHFKGSVGEQVVEYVGVLTRTRGRIVGCYLSQDPDDAGHFCLAHP